MGAPEELAAIAEQLYRGSPEDFVARRTERVKQAREAKNRELATAIGALRRPTRSAWLVDLLADGATEPLEELFEIGAGLQRAQQERSGTALRELSTRRRSVVDALVRRSVELADEQGYSAPESARQEVAQTLQAALADAEVGDAVRRGVLAEVMTYGGFGGFGEPGDLTPSAPAAQSAPRSPNTGRGKHFGLREGEQRQQAERKAEEQEARARTELAEAEAELAAAEQRSEEATAEADRLSDEVDRLSSELKAAEEASRQAARRARSVRKDVEHQRSAVEAARRRVG